MGVLLPLKISICTSIITDMKKFEITNETIGRHLSLNEIRNEKSPNTESKGTMIIQEKYGTIKFKRRLSHPKMMIWRQLQTQKRYSNGCPITKEPSKGTTVVQLILSIPYQDHT